MSAAMKVSMRSTVAVRPARATSVVVRAESRRSVLSGFLAGAAALTAAGSASALSPVDIFDDRAVREKGFDLIYEARELGLPQNTRDGLTQARGSIEDTRARVAESTKRILTAVKPSIEKAYWTDAREELRRQVGTLRFDLGTLASAKVGKADKKKAIALNKDFLTKVEKLDFSLRSKDQDAARAGLLTAKEALDAVLAFSLL
eukprot:gene13055-3659_t